MYQKKISREGHRLPCCLIAEWVPPKIAAEQRRKAKRKAQKHQKILTQTYLDLLSWNMFVTNVPPHILSAAQVGLLYRVRWQIELLFKLWKSYAGLKFIGLWRRDRVLTELYAKLIGCVLFQFLTAPLRIPADQWDGQELSLFKAHRILTRFAHRLASALHNLAVLEQLLDRFLEDLLLFAIKQRRRKRPNVFQRLASALA